MGPGTIVSVFGTHLAPDLGSLAYGESAAYPISLGNAAVGANTITVNGVPAAVLYASPTQINAVVPFGTAGSQPAEVVVSRHHFTAKATVRAQATAPGVFTATGTGTGQGTILNYTGGLGTGLNSSSNPANRGDAIVFWITGAGVWSPAVPDGLVALSGTDPQNGMRPKYALAATPITLTIGGKPATLFYIGASAYMPWASVQVNAFVPSDAPSGDQPLVIQIGQSDNAAQRVTVAIR